jgi:hypothetical protein
MPQAIYALNMSVTGADHPAYYSIALSSGTSGPGSFSCTPAETQYTYVSFQGGITFQIPGGVASGGAAVTTTNGMIAGDVFVSPAVEVPVQIMLYYQGKIIESYEMEPGQSEGSFSWNVASTSDTEGDPKSILNPIIAPPPRK